MSLVKVDRLIRPQHAHLDAEDDCYFFGEYTARMGFAYSDTNQLILNFKKSVERRGCSDFIWKQRAIRAVGKLFRDALAGTPDKQRALQSYTLIPMPPSKSRQDPLYDDRLRQMLDVLGSGLQLDIREILVAGTTMRSSHGSENRPSVAEIQRNLSIDEQFANPAPRAAVLFDDTLVSGAHFKAAQGLLQSRFPGIPVTGMFIARRTFNSDGI